MCRRSLALSGRVAASLMSLFFSLLFQSLFFALAPTVNLPFAFCFLVFSHANLHEVKNTEVSRQNTLVSLNY
jgi:hypothetical protein